MTENRLQAQFRVTSISHYCLKYPFSVKTFSKHFQCWSFMHCLHHVLMVKDTMPNTHVLLLRNHSSQTPQRPDLTLQNFCPAAAITMTTTPIIGDDVVMTSAPDVSFSMSPLQRLCVQQTVEFASAAEAAPSVAVGCTSVQFSRQPREKVVVFSIRVTSN